MVPAVLKAGAAMTANRVSPSRGVLIAIAFLFGALIAIWRSAPDGTTDFGHFWLSARYWAHPYSESVAKGVYAAPYWWPEVRRHDIFVYSYPPTLLLLTWPLSKIPMMAAFMLFNGATAATFMALCVRRVGSVAVLALFSLPLFCSLILGQIGLLASCAVIAAFEVMEKRPRLAGALLACVVCIKPQVALAAPFVLWGRWPVVRAATAVSVCILLASLAFGPGLWPQWLHQIGLLKAQQPMLPQVAPSVLFGGALWWRAVLLVIGIGFATWERGLTGFLVGTFLCSPYFWLYDLAGFSFLGLLIVAESRRLGLLKGLPPIMAGLLLVAYPCYAETNTIFCLVLIALRVLVGRTAIGRAISFAPARAWFSEGFAAPKAARP